MNKMTAAKSITIAATFILLVFYPSTTVSFSVTPVLTPGVYKNNIKTTNEVIGCLASRHPHPLPLQQQYRQRQQDVKLSTTANSCTETVLPSPINSTTPTTTINKGNSNDNDPFLTPIILSSDLYNAQVGEPLPTVFAYPHCYEPHPIATYAAEQLKEQLHASTEFQRNIINDEDAVGKMMGVLVVQYGHNDDNNNNQQQQPQLGYLKAYSGTLPTASMDTHCKEAGLSFCPPVYNRFQHDGFYKHGEEELNALTNSFETLQHSPERQRRKDFLIAVEETTKRKWLAAKAEGKVKQKERRTLREQQKELLNDEEYNALDERLKQEGAYIQRQHKQLKSRHKSELQNAQRSVQQMEDELQSLKSARKTKSRQLQDTLFRQYTFLNIQNQTRSLLPMFADTPLGRPPSGAGDCAAPKLFQYAFSQKYTPIAMAEFWWGTSPAKELRRHGLYYPACRGKCQPILEFMLGGMEVGCNPNDVAPTATGTTTTATSDDDDAAAAAANGEEQSQDGSCCPCDELSFELEMLYEDEHMMVVNKPEGMLSAPGRTLEYSVYSQMKEKYPEATGPLLVHRLDMSTSGVLLLAKDKDVHKALAKQFIDRSVQKRYVALLDGELDSDTKKGKIDLPLAPDYINRPMQMVTEEGKPAKTIYEVVEVIEGVTRVNFYPVTGRTHQLRVHAAHPRGLDLPIVGDDIYGARDAERGRLCLHAGYLELTHPVMGKRMTFTAPTPF